MKKIVMLALVLGLIVPALSVSAKSGKEAFSEAPPAPAGYALVYIYRPNCPPKMRRATIVMDSEDVLKLPNKGVSWFYLKEGTHTLQTRWGALSQMPKLEFVVNAVSGDTYFMRMKGSVRNMGSYDEFFNSIDYMTADTAFKEMSKLSYTPADVQTVN